MSRAPNRQVNKESNQQADSIAPLDLVQQLTWALLDEELSDEQLSQLGNLLGGSEAARENYLHCVQLHTNLLDHFGRLPKAAQPVAPVKSPILGFLNSGFPPIATQPTQLKQ